MITTIIVFPILLQPDQTTGYLSEITDALSRLKWMFTADSDRQGASVKHVSLRASLATTPCDTEGWGRRGDCAPYCALIDYKRLSLWRCACVRIVAARASS